MSNQTEDESMPTGTGSVALTGVAGLPPSTEKRARNGKKIKEVLGKGLTKAKAVGVESSKAVGRATIKTAKYLGGVFKEEAKSGIRGIKTHIEKSREIREAEREAYYEGLKGSSVSLARRRGMQRPMQVERMKEERREHRMKEPLFTTPRIDVGGFRIPEARTKLRPLDIHTGIKPLDLGGFKKHKKTKDKGIWI